MNNVGKIPIINPTPPDKICELLENISPLTALIAQYISKITNPIKIHDTTENPGKIDFNC